MYGKVPSINFLIGGKVEQEALGEQEQEKKKGTIHNHRQKTAICSTKSTIYATAIAKIYFSRIFHCLVCPINPIV
jgi:hypothetical protein